MPLKPIGRDEHHHYVKMDHLYIKNIKLEQEN